MSKTGFRCKIPEVPGVRPSFTLSPRPGYTAVVGPNGAGKTTLLRQLMEVAIRRKYRFFYYTGPEQSTSLPSLERILYRNLSVNKDDPAFIFLDGVDAGISVDRLAQIMDTIRQLERIAGVHPGGVEHELYIVAAVNSYAMARGVCVDARTGETGCLLGIGNMRDSFLSISRARKTADFYIGYLMTQNGGGFLKDRLFITAEAVIAGLMLEWQSYYVDLEQIEKFETFVKDQVLHGTLFTEYKTVIIDAGHSAIVRFAQYRRRIFDLTEERIYLVGAQEELLDLASTNPQVRQAICDFVAIS